jgi:mono/diheme cytochrome c family protein
LLRRLLVGGSCVGAVIVMAMLAFAWQPAIAPIASPSPQSFAQPLVARGAILASAGNCAACHTVKDGAPFAGGYPVPTPFGTIYSTNITPDRVGGIGAWSLAAFTRAMRQGVSRDGRHLFPAFPYDHFTKLTDSDIEALYAYLMTLPAVRAETPANEVLFPFDMRALQALWSALFVTEGPYQPNDTKSAEWNRGAYLAEGLAHCGACHTMRNVLGAEERGHPYGGAPIEGWAAWPLDVSPSPARWTREDFFTYLRGGTTIHGRAIGPMGPVVRALTPLPDSDVMAIATYFADLIRPQSATPEETARQTLERARHDPPDSKDEQGARLYASACSSCHGGTNSASATKAELPLSTSLWSDKPHNFMLTVLDGVGGVNDAPGPPMPAFRQSLSSADIVMIENYLRHTWLHEPGWPYTPVAIDRLRVDPMSLPWIR